MEAVKHLSAAAAAAAAAVATCSDMPV